MIDLTDAVGFPLALDAASCRLASSAWRSVEPDVRTLEQMRPVLRDPTADGPKILYWMYRDAGLSELGAEAGRMGLRFDLTVLRPGAVGGEYVKTFGHTHPLAADGLPYPELYQVVHGSAWFLLQDEREARIIPAEAGDCALIPPGFGHVTVNVGEEPLVLANWVCAGFSSDYGAFRRLRGAAVYVLRPDEPSRGVPAGAGDQPHRGPRIEPNPNYRRPLAVTFGKPIAPSRLDLRAGEPIFTAVVRNPTAYQFLVRPRQGCELWSARD